MCIGKGCILSVLTAVALHAQTIDLNGTVTNAEGNPVPDAIVTLLGENMTDTTDEHGEFSFKNTVGTGLVLTVPERDAISMSKGVIILSLTKTAPVKIELFDLNGNCIENVTTKRASAGTYRFTIHQEASAACMMLVRASIGRHSSTFRYLPLKNNAYIRSSSMEGGEKLAKVMADVDSIEVAADGYETKVVTISSYEDEIDITLEETVSDLDPFSFFVTSMRGLQELAGSDDGFGGDLRFGHTGPGAGLKGADSICECLAEMSMPGSKVKQWRAFLSVTDDGTGRQVNAIDRIGEGPWYDRLGRLLAPTIADLLNERPQNGDPEIQNDLPNEWGVPNHRPDPTQPEEDNHHMITGSNEQGELFGSGATCDDWTSTTAGGSPRCGFSWPRFGARKTIWGGGGGGMNGSHWISGFNAGGCRAGIHITNDFGGESGIIGAGGGYGGFYCFALKP